MLPTLQRALLVLCSVPLSLALIGQRDPLPLHSPAHPTRPMDRAGMREDLGRYCTPGYTAGAADGDRIDGVYFGTITNTTVIAETALGYTDYSYEGSDMITQVERDNVYPLTILVGPYDPPEGSFEQYKVWVDFDQDGEFSAFEEVLNVQTTAAFQDVIADIFIPADARSGYTSMRIRCVYNDPDFDACSSQNYGETEDYVILVNGELPCIPYTQYGPHANDFIGGVAVNGTTILQQGSVPDHAYATSLGVNAQVRRNEIMEITITSGAFATDQFGAWADWNMDGDFDDADEQLAWFPIAGTFTPSTFTVTVPADAAVGYTLLRVRCVYDEVGVTPCSPSVWGETQDLSLAVLDGVFPCLPGSAGTALGDGFSSVTFDGTTYWGTQQWPFYQLSNVAHQLDRGTNVALNIVGGTYLPQTYDVWLDMNDNGDFSDPGEALGSIAASSIQQALQIDAFIPANCPPGQHILRVRGFDTNNGSPSACGDLVFGELLDIPVVITDPDGVCIPYSPYWTRSGDYIDGVELGDINNTLSGGSHAAPYRDFTTLSTTLNIGSVHTITVTGGAYAGDNYSAWIDFNADGDWDDGGENIGSVVIPDVHGTGTITFTVPAVALGEKVMRVRCSFQPLTNACADDPYGETEDYTVEISTSTGLDRSSTSAVQVIPLYSDGVVQLQSNSTAPTAYDILDATGRIIRSGQVNSPTTLIPMDDAASGVHVLMLNGTQAERFVWNAR